MLKMHIKMINTLKQIILITVKMGALALGLALSIPEYVGSKCVCAANKTF
jgi:hypothetical protein